MITITGRSALKDALLGNGGARRRLLGAPPWRLAVLGFSSLLSFRAITGMCCICHDERTVVMVCVFKDFISALEGPSAWAILCRRR